jgi:hypothetical protein
MNLLSHRWLNWVAEYMSHWSRSGSYEPGTYPAHVRPSARNNFYLPTLIGHEEQRFNAAVFRATIWTPSRTLYQPRVLGTPSNEDSQPLPNLFFSLLGFSLRDIFYWGHQFKIVVHRLVLKSSILADFVYYYKKWCDLQIERSEVRSRMLLSLGLEILTLFSCINSHLNH